MSARDPRREDAETIAALVQRAALIGFVAGAVLGFAVGAWV